MTITLEDCLYTLVLNDLTCKVWIKNYNRELWGESAEITLTSKQDLKLEVGERISFNLENISFPYFLITSIEMSKINGEIYIDYTFWKENILLGTDL